MTLGTVLGRFILKLQMFAKPTKKKETVKLTVYYDVYS